MYKLILISILSFSVNSFASCGTQTDSTLAVQFFHAQNTYELAYSGGLTPCEFRCMSKVDCVKSCQSNMGQNAVIKHLERKYGQNYKSCTVWKKVNQDILGTNRPS